MPEPTSEQKSNGGAVMFRVSRPTAILLAILFSGGLGTNLVMQTTTRNDVSSIREVVLKEAQEHVNALRASSEAAYARKDVVDAKFDVISARFDTQDAKLDAIWKTVERMERK